MFVYGFFIFCKKDYLLNVLLKFMYLKLQNKMFLITKDKTSFEKM